MPKALHYLSLGELAFLLERLLRTLAILLSPQMYKAAYNFG